MTDQVVEALQTLIASKDENLLALWARELNLYQEALRTRGARTMFSADDVRTLLCRVLDIAKIKPTPKPAALEPKEQTEGDEVGTGIAKIIAPLGRKQ